MRDLRVGAAQAIREATIPVTVVKGLHFAHVPSHIFQITEGRLAIE